MAKLTSKAELLEESQKEYETLEQLLEPLTAEQLAQPGRIGEWSVKDILAHLYEWQQMFFGWYDAGLRGAEVHTPGRGYTWSQLGALNQEIFETYRSAPLEEIRVKFQASHQRMIALIQERTEEELFKPGFYPWTGKGSLAGYIHANTGGHYHWASAALRKQLKPRKKQPAN